MIQQGLAEFHGFQNVTANPIGKGSFQLRFNQKAIVNIGVLKVMMTTNW